MKATLKDLFKSGKVILADGGMGTTLFALGLDRGVAPELWNLERSETITEIHRRYIEVGAQIILSNSFGGNRARLSRHGLEERTRDVNLTAAALARKEADSAPEAVVVGGSIGPSGVLMEPLGDLSRDEAESIFAEQVSALVEGGVDVLWIETMSDLEEVSAALCGCNQAAPNFPRVVTMTFDTHGHTSMGVSPEKALQELAAYRLAAVGANCGNGPAEVETAIGKMYAANPSIPLVAKSNVGFPSMIDGQAVYDATPDEMAEHALKVHGLGAQIIGACCGSTAEHIRAMGEALRA